MPDRLPTGTAGGPAMGAPATEQVGRPDQADEHEGHDHQRQGDGEAGHDHEDHPAIGEEAEHQPGHDPHSAIVGPGASPGPAQRQPSGCHQLTPP